MDRPSAEKYVIEEKLHGLKIWVEGGVEKLNLAIEEASQFGHLDKNMLERNFFVLEIRPTFDKSEVIDFLHSRFNEIL